MRRDWDVMRKVMLKIEALPTEDSTLTSSDIEGIDAECAAYHMRLLIEAGMVSDGCRDAVGPVYCHASRLTWDGHELLDQIKRDTVWNKVKETARIKGVDLSFGVIRLAAETIIKSMLG